MTLYYSPTVSLFMILPTSRIQSLVGEENLGHEISEEGSGSGELVVAREGEGGGHCHGDSSHNDNLRSQF